MKDIVAAYAGTEACAVALDRAAALAERAGATLHVVSAGIPVVPVGGFGWVAPYEELRPTEQLIAARCDEAAARVRSGVAIETHPVIGRPAAEIVEVAKKVDAGLVVLGNARHGTLERLFLGSTADQVVRLAPMPCLVATAAAPATRILVAADDSDFSERALRAALTLSALGGAPLRCVHVVATPPDEAHDFVSQVNEYFERFVRRVANALELPEGQATGEISTVLRVGEAGEEILAEADAWNAELVSVGTHGRSFFQRALLGSVSQYVLRHARGSVLICS